MRVVDIIIKKRESQELSKEEIGFFIQGFTDGEIPDYQAAAFAMAVCLNGMNARETTDLTLAMVASGEQLDLSDVVKRVVDKHSTGGVGDKTSIVVAPIVAACGLPVGKMSGRGLGFSGGTLDKLESILGYRCDLTMEEFRKQLAEVGLVLTGQSADLAPADGKLYSLRDVTGTVESLPLIASSIMSKKIAAGAHAIVLDVKVGNGAFMKTLDSARELGRLMVEIGKLAGRETVALISDMNQPLGRAVGNSLEVKEAIDTLKGGGPDDFREHCITVAAHMLVLGDIADNLEKARERVEQALKETLAFDKLKEFIAAQGGDLTPVNDPEKFPKAPLVESVPAPRGGYLQQIHARTIGETAVFLGAGRARKTDIIDHRVGIEILHKVGDYVEPGEPLFIVHASRGSILQPAIQQILEAHHWSDEPVPSLPLFYEVIR